MRFDDQEKPRVDRRTHIDGRITPEASPSPREAEAARLRAARSDSAAFPQKTGAAASISVRRLTRIYEVPGRKDARVIALDGVDADFPEGSFTAVVGASGSGKSTLLHCMAGLDEPTGGRVTILGSATSEMKPAKRATFRARHVGFVFQEYNLIASLTAAENVSMPSRLAGHALSKGQIDAALDAVGLRHRANLKPHQLSGGERQRVAIARVMASEPRIVFADEPTGALDSGNSRVVLGALREMGEGGTTVVIVTHDPAIASSADRVAFMSDGRIMRVATALSAGEVLEGMGQQYGEAPDA